ncbi:MAG: preprotein translocase subunit SecG [Bdellovibrionales bacterium]|nr:preprotein translocase subunit SecG [Bdellovibrionales bacterium]
MLTFISILHIVIALFLILLILIQDSKGGGLGVMSGGSQSILGASGADNLIAKATRWTGLLFAGTCIALTLYNVKGNKSVLDGMPASAIPASQSAPAAADVPAEQAPATEKTGN